jgi:hypothetical protein
LLLAIAQTTASRVSGAIRLMVKSATPASNSSVADEMVMEGSSAATNQGLQLHVECFSLWDEARDAPGRTSVEARK